MASEIQMQETFRETEDDSLMEVSSNVDAEVDMGDSLDTDRMDIDIDMHDRY